MKPAAFYAAYIVKKLWYTVAILLVGVAVTLSLLRYSLPYMDGQKQHLEQWLENQYGVEINIGKITAQWQSSGPVLVLEDLQLVQNSQSPISLDIGQTFVELDFWGSVLARQIRSHRFDLNALNLKIDLNSLQQDQQGDFPVIEALKQLFLEQLQSFSVSNSQFEITVADDQQVLLINQLTWTNQDDHHQGVGQLQVEELASNSTSFTLDLFGDKNDLRGTFFAQAKDVDLSPWINQWLTTRHELVESRANFVIWAGIAKSKIINAQFKLAESQFKWTNQDEPIEAIILGGEINAEPANDGWIYNFQEFALSVNSQTLTTNWEGAVDAQGQLRIQNAERFQIAPLLPLLPLVLSSQNVEVMYELSPRARVDKLNVQLAGEGQTVAHLAMSDVQWQQGGDVPGLNNIAAQINWFQDSGRLQVNGRNALLKIDNLLDQDIEFQTLDVDVYLHTSERGFELFAPKLSIKSEWLNAEQVFFYRSQDSYLSLSGSIEALDVQLASRLYPASLMGKKTKEYLVNALQQGQIEGAKYIWNGALADYPFSQGQGIFQASVAIKRGQLKFAPGWPALTNLDMALLFENAGLHMTSQQGSLLDVKLSELVAIIPTLKADAILTIDAKASATGQQVSQLMLQSSIADTLGETLQQVQIRQSLGVDLNLHIPLGGDPVIATGIVNLNNNQLAIPKLDLNLSKIKGKVSFQNEQVNFSGLKAQLFAQPVIVDFSGKDSDTGYLANIALQGFSQVAPLVNEHLAGLTEYLQGEGAWQAEVQLTLPEEGFSYQASLNSNLTGVTSHLPAPLAKTSQQSMPLVLNVQGDGQASTISARLGTDLVFDGVLPHKSMQFSRAHLALGETQDMTMGLGFSIEAILPHLDIDGWYQVVSTLINELPSQGDSPLLGEPQRVFIRANTATVASQNINLLDVVAKNTSDSWSIELNAKQARAKLSLYKDWLVRGVQINADFIDLSDWQLGQSRAVNFSPKLANLPPIEFSCTRCRFQTSNLGQVDFRLSRAANGMHIDSLRLNNEHGLLYATGDWLLDETSSSTELSGEFSSADFGLFLKGFKFESGIKDSKAAASFNVNWQRAPYEFNFASLNGDVDWRLSDGYLTEVTDKGSRIFSILSLESLVRKLRLDFRDVFGKGFFYDKMKGSFEIAEGTVDTRNTVVDGSAGEITMHGYTNLVSRELNYRIAFAPKVTSSLPLIVAYMVNPATALAALALDQVLTSAKVISNIKFSLTGTIDDPQLEELQRDSKEISLPAQNKPVSGDNKLDTGRVAPKIDQQRVTLAIPDV
ncbi:MAG: hypothetical protein ACI9C4_001291 [Paraglaciecola sp.]